MRFTSLSRAVRIDKRSKEVYFMPKLRKMLGDINSLSCRRLMDLISTQSHRNLSGWAIQRAQRRYLPIYKKLHPEDTRLDRCVEECMGFSEGTIKAAKLRAILKESADAAKQAVSDPISEAAARAVAVACASVRTPTNTLGFLFYGAAAVAYDSIGTEQSRLGYEKLAEVELNDAYDELKSIAVENEPNPADIDWNC